MIAVYLPDDGEGKSYDLMLVNPKIMSHSIQEAYLPTGEGCLSVDENIPGLVHRKYRITVKAKDIDGNDVKLRLKGYPAVVVQHEIDHINGIMFYDHIDSEHPLQPHEDAVEYKRTVSKRANRVRLLTVLLHKVVSSFMVYNIELL